MARYCIHLAYNGLNYCGWQTQPEVPSVQQTLEEALSTLLRQKIALVGCGRTDTGVHAADFYAHFDLEPLAQVADDEENIAKPVENASIAQSLCAAVPDCRLNNIAFKLNSFLPQDIRIYDLFRVPDNFHARFDATARTYQYHVSDQRLPFRQGLYNRIYFRPNLELLNAGARALMDYEDFTSFAKLHTQVKTNICHLYEAHWDRVGEEWVFTIKANRFLRNMVRAITGTLLDVGRGALSMEGLRAIVEQKDRCAAGTSVPAQGLFLVKVDYPIFDGPHAEVQRVE